METDTAEALADAGSRHSLISGTSTTGQLLAAVGLLLPIAYVDSFLVPSWTPRMALVLLVIPLGCGALIELLRRGDRAAWAGLTFMTACVLATFINDVPLWNLRGGFGRESSVVFSLGFFATWAAARHLPLRDRRMVALTTCLGLAVSAIVALVQLAVAPSTGFFAMIGQRPSGLQVNPVFFGAAMSGVGALSAHAWARERAPARVTAPALVGAALLVGYSGSRAASIGFWMAVGGAVVLASGRSRRLGIAVAALCGFIVSSLPLPGRDTRDAVERFSGEGDGRFSVWAYGLRAWSERPVRGYGYGQFRPAVQGHFSPQFVEESALDVSGAAWPDAHNVFVQYSIVGGTVAVVALVAFVYFSSTISRGPLAWAAAATAVSWLFQPVTLATAPIVAIWLGLASNRPDELSDRPARVDALLAATGILIAMPLLMLDWRLDSSIEDGDYPTFASWVEAAPSDPVLANTTASFASRTGRASEALEWRSAAAQLEPRDAVTLALLARQRAEVGDFDGASDAAWTAITVDPYNPVALDVALAVAALTSDIELAEHARELACAIGRC